MSLRPIKRHLAVLLALTSASAFAQTAAAAPAPQPILVELFTSEGCSSCPPADALLAKLQGMHTPSGQPIVVLSEHVTYWNHDGWVDPFSDDTYTQRQATYVDRLHAKEAYTPQIVVNGNTQVLGSDGRAIMQALQAQKPDATLKLQIAKAVYDGGKIALTYSVDGPLPPEGGDLYAAVADDTETSNVARGENAGKTVSHVAVVRSLTHIGKLKPGAAATVKLSAPKPKDPANAGQHVVLFAQAKGQGPIWDIVTADVPPAQ